MGTIRLGTFPSLNNKALQDDVAKCILKWFLQHFSNKFFNHIYLDTQTNAANAYRINENGELFRLENGAKILQPALKMEIKQGTNNHNDVFGSLWNVNQQPGAFAIDTDLTGYKPFFYDPYGIILATNEYTIRNQFDFTIDLQTKADQLAFYNICDNNLKSMYVQTIECDTGIVLPSLLMEYIRNCIFKSENDALSKMIADSQEKITYRQEIINRFNEYLYKFSNGAIKPFREQNVETGITNYLYKLNRKQLLTFHLERPEGDEGTKKGGSYYGFQVTFSGWVEYANPISFISSVPAIIRGTKTDHFIRTSSNTNTNNEYNLMTFKEVFKDDRHLVDINNSKWAHFYFEREIMMASTNEYFNVLDDVIMEEDTPSHYYIMKMLLMQIDNIDKFNQLFKVVIYKNNEPLDKYYYDIDEHFNFTIRNCDLSIPYYIDIWVNRSMYEMYMDKVVYELNAIGIHIDNKEVNAHFRKYDRHGCMYKVRHGYHPDYIGERSYFYNTKMYKGLVNDQYKTFIPIKTKHFLAADPKYDYYTISVKGNYIPVENEVVEKRDDLDYYITDPTTEEFLKIDRNKILIPDQKYTYFLYNQETRAYDSIDVSQGFDDEKQYYICQDNVKINNINVSGDEND